MKRFPALAVAACILLAPGLAPAAGSNAPAAPASSKDGQPPQTTFQRARAILDEALIARNPDTRKEAVQALSLIGPREPYLTRLMVMTKDDDVPVRVAAISSLVDLHDNRALPAIRGAYDDPVPEVSFAAAKALLAFGDATGRDALIDVVNGGDDSASDYVSSNGRAVKRLYYAPKAAFPYLMARTIGFAHVAGLGAGVASVEGIMADQDVNGRAAAVLLLGTDKDPRVLPALRHALKDKDSIVRAAAAHAIAVRDDPSLEPDLVPLLDDKRIDARARAAAGCLRLELIASEAQTTNAPAPATTQNERNRRSKTH